MPTLTWNQRIAEARARGRFTEEEKSLASEWVTCACGEQDPRIPRQAPGRTAPKDERLFDLGVEFASAVYWNRFDDADYLLRSIEMRASELLVEAAAGKVGA